ncbi:hypothetical protein [Limnohabitans sp.]|uniref:hypothetical protein n=1 Tax=Limnohabitans sp. TaxID=1907725 RepID=UPI00286F476C|nr:hypothetical protein [Limnohabitans sp.]
MTVVQKRHAAQASVVRTASGQFITSHRMSDPEVADLVRAYRAEIGASSQTASAFLQKVGILTKTGKLSKKFGG